jgi:hypothetical protein
MNIVARHIYRYTSEWCVRAGYPRTLMLVGVIAVMGITQLLLASGGEAGQRTKTALQIPLLTFRGPLDDVSIVYSRKVALIRTLCLYAAAFTLYIGSFMSP